MRRTLTCDCAGDFLVASLDPAPGTTALVIVTGGRQARQGAHGGQSRLAARVATAGYPVLRYDRRGIGDSDGSDPGWREQGADLAAAVTLLRVQQPHITRIVGYGLCDAAAALILHGGGAGIDALILANPWVVETEAGFPPPAAIRRRYRERLLSPAAWGRLLTGGIDLGKAIRGLRATLRPPGALSDDLARALTAAKLPVTIMLAERDATAIAFADATRRGWPKLTLRTRPSASHGFAGEGDEDWLANEVIAALTN